MAHLRIARLRAASTIVSCCLALALEHGASPGEPLSVQAVHEFAWPFLSGQEPNGAYGLGSQIQRHLKAEISMALASEATGDTAYALSALRNMEWVVARHLESDGGLNWTGGETDSPYFFEVHQHWFLIASELIRRTTGVDGPISAWQTRVWGFLLGDNPACADFYLNNRFYHGPFFAYRSLDRDGLFQTQGAFKGSYEIGTALWSLALHRHSYWLNDWQDDKRHDPPLPSLTVEGYLDSLAHQACRPADGLGFVEPADSLWVRSLGWTDKGWSGWEGHDWKYSLHMQEGALLYQIQTGSLRLLETELRETERLLALLEPDGSIRDLPDNLGSPDYEYGEALSVFGLSAIAFRDLDRGLSDRCLEAGQRVARHALNAYMPRCSEEGAVLLAGLCRVYLAQGKGGPGSRP